MKKSKKGKIWKTSTADAKFREYMFKVSDKRCKRCGKTDNLQVSHFWTRNVSSVRYEPLNCIILCLRCHYGDFQYGWEYQKQGKYQEFMIGYLGEDKYKWLENLYHKIIPRREAIRNFMNLYHSFNEKYK